MEYNLRAKASYHTIGHSSTFDLHSGQENPRIKVFTSYFLTKLQIESIATLAARLRKGLNLSHSKIEISTRQISVLVFLDSRLGRNQLRNV